MFGGQKTKSHLWHDVLKRAGNGNSNGNSNDILEVYNYYGIQGEKVPKTTQKLIVEEGVQEFPYCIGCDWNDSTGATICGKFLLQLGWKRLERRLFNLLKWIGHCAFQWTGLKQVEFAPSPTAPSQLTIIGDNAFLDWMSLKRINKLPSSGVKQIGEATFEECCSLQTISLPKTLGGIGELAFRDCSQLVTFRLFHFQNDLKDEEYR